MSAAATIAARRLLLTADELDVLRRLSGDLRLPADFRMDPRPSPRTDGRPVGVVGVESADSVRALRDRGVVLGAASEPERTGPDTVHPSVRANMAVLAAPELLLETRVQTEADGHRPRTIRAAHAVTGMLGASLVRVDRSAAAELSIFPAEALGAELRRVVPPVGRPERADQRPSGLVPLAALTHLGLAGDADPAVLAEVTTGLSLAAAALSRARALQAQATGVLQVTVLVPPHAAGDPGRVGQVVWYATAGGWVGLAPEPGPRGVASVRLRPADPEHLGTWLAPMVGEAIQ